MEVLHGTELDAGVPLVCAVGRRHHKDRDRPDRPQAEKVTIRDSICADGYADIFLAGKSLCCLLYIVHKIKDDAIFGPLLFFYCIYREPLIKSEISCGAERMV